MEEYFIELLTTPEYGYAILFVWSIMEGEMGLIMAGVLCHTRHMFYPTAVLVAALGGFTGDQIYFYIGRFNKGYIHKLLHRQRRKFAIAHLLLRKYGWSIIFIQRYLYGLRTVIPLSIGLTKYSAKRFAFINLISAFIWAAMTITPAYYFGEQILTLVQWARAHWYLSLPVAVTVGVLVYRYFHSLEKRMFAKQAARQLRMGTASSK